MESAYISAYAKRLTLLNNHKQICTHPFITASKYKTDYSTLDLMTKCSFCRNEINELIKEQIINLDHTEHKTKGRETKTFMQRLLFKPCDEDVEVYPKPIPYWKWSLLGMPNNSYDISLLYDYNSKCFDLVTCNGTKMFRVLAQIYWESVADKYNETNTNNYRKLYKIKNTNYISPNQPNTLYESEPRMYGNARGSDPAACYRSDYQLNECIEEIRKTLGGSSLSERNKRVYIYPTLTRSYDLTRLEAEVLIKWVNIGRYKGEFTPTINPLH
jgi:hypothetical protein